MKSAALTVLAGGRSRTVMVYSPPGVAHPAPLVLNLHGSGGSAVQQESFSAMDALAEAHGFIVAYPQASIVLGSGFAWNVPGQALLGGKAVPAGSADDVQYIAQTIATLEETYSIDPKRVFVTGMSGGARMTSQIGCDLAAVVAAIAPVAGLRFPAPCPGARAVPVVAFHGTADNVNPYEGHGQAYWTYGVASAEQQWAAHDGCPGAPVASQAALGVTLTTYAHCGGSADVSLYSIDGAAHEWPGAPAQTKAIDANEAMWAFFAAHPLP